MPEKPTSDWQSGELTRTFLDGVRGAIPGADLQLEVIGKIAQRWAPETGSILDLGCGNGILGRFLLERFPSARGVFVDFSEPMLEAVRATTKDIPRASIVRADFSTPRWIEALPDGPPFGIVVSGFAIHHQPNQRKRELYAEIFEMLAPGGVFLNLDHVASATGAGQDLFEDFFVDRLYEYHGRSDPQTDRETIAEDYYNRPDKKENILAPVGRQCEWLREIGFADVDCFFKVFELALFGGRKA